MPVAKRARNEKREERRRRKMRGRGCEPKRVSQYRGLLSMLGARGRFPKVKTPKAKATVEKASVAVETTRDLPKRLLQLGQKKGKG